VKGALEMVERKTRWQLATWNEEQEDLAQKVSKQFNIPRLVAKLLIQRGYQDGASIEAFLYSKPTDLHDPYELAGMREAVERIKQARAQGEQVRIYGDYDADGVSSTSLLYYTFQRYGLKFDYYIPHRMLEGYGLNKGAIDKAKQDGVGLIVTVDTGISAYDEVQYAASLGIDVVVTDHHEPPEQALALPLSSLQHCLKLLLWNGAELSR
jgi:single-stranded-DNA-specific exonuclease